MGCGVSKLDPIQKTSQPKKQKRSEDVQSPSKTKKTTSAVPDITISEPAFDPPTAKEVI